MAFQKATKKQAKLRLALFGISGGGKTYSALRIASGITSITGGRIAFIDTESRSACKYSDRFDFDVDELDKPSINNVVMSMKEASKYDVLIIDSLTHTWLELLAEMDLLTNGKNNGNSWRSWSVGTPKQNKFIKALLDFPGHIIATMRAETNWTTQQVNGKTVPVRIGEAPKQGKGIEYEFDMLMQISSEHVAEVIKDRTGKYQDMLIDKPDEEFGQSLVSWLSEGEAVIEEDEGFTDEEIEEIASGAHRDCIELSEEEMEDEPPQKPKKSKKNLVVEEREDATDEEFVEEFKVRAKRILDIKQIKLFQKQNNLSVKEPESIRKFMTEADLELSMAKFLEEVGK